MRPPLAGAVPAVAVQPGNIEPKDIFHVDGKMVTNGFFAVKKKGAVKPGAVGAKDSNVQLKVGNKEAQDAIAIAIQDSKTNKAIGSALKDLQESADKGDAPLWKQQAQTLGRVKS